MAHYLMSVLDERSGSGTAEEMAAIDVFNDRLRTEGHWVFAGGLAAPGTATVVDGRDGEAVLTDGPYVETKEFVAGFWIIDAPHLDAALRLAAQGSASCNRRLELRPFVGVA
ncbi:YciI family protein [Cellulomonas sp. ICMP 17802]|uniref:YciI family protein n=1 Tax=Cellulomonas sp. ICMP 17802 TaxID=3239199 RepID=UPI00351AF692